VELKGARALVTGGSDGIGLAIGQALVEKGARVALMARRSDRVAAAAKEIGALGITGDVSKPGDAAAAVARAVQEFGGLDILINNAGSGTFGPLTELKLEDFERTFATNVTGAMLMARAAAPHMIRQASGNIMNIASTAGLKGFANGTTYCATKFALRGMTECWREELRRHNIRVTLVNPSEVQTNFGVAAGGQARQYNAKKLRAEEIARAIVGALQIDDRGFIPEFSVFATNPFPPA
jgi:3-oxoacyl-[acyl-carrier protein] reductase